MRQADTRKILFVLGMHRSGTSALCASLQACGASFGTSLLEPMAGVNEEGFWEDAGVVAVNDSLLEAVGASWYSATSGLLDTDWGAADFDDQRERAREILARGFGEGPLEAVKDPRLCLTLPFWTALCARMGIATAFCAINRAPMAVASSLQSRDGFPPGYGLRLFEIYNRGIARYIAGDVVYISYDALLADPVRALEPLAAALPITVSGHGLESAVRRDLRHHASSGGSGVLYDAPAGPLNEADLSGAISTAYPVAQTLADMAGALVERGRELTRVGGLHSVALATIDERDRQIAETNQQVLAANQRVSEAGEELARLNGQLSKLGEEHTYALDLIRSRDAQLQRVMGKPVIGLLFRALWKYEQR